jgi:outer membrane protein
MKKTLVLCLSPLVLALSQQAHAVDLLGVYQDGLKNDPTYSAAKTTYLSAMQDVPINRAVLLPQLVFGQSGGGSAFISKTQTSGELSGSNDDYSQRGYGFSLNLTQELFNFPDFEALKEAKLTVKSAAATYYAAAQDLMVRVATAYFTILKDQDVVRYTEANVESNKKSLDQATQQYNVGLKTLTDVYTSQAAYSSAVSEDVAAKNTLATDIENLRAITGKSYDAYDKLSDDFPLASPDPKSIEDWVKVSVNHNWSLKSSIYTMQAAMEEIKVQWGGHLPTVSLSASYGNNIYNQVGVAESDSGADRTKSAAAAVNMSIPIFEGGSVTANTKQAEYNYQTDVYDMELEYRTVVSDTRQDYLSVLSGISAVDADLISVKSNINALKGLEAGYKVGTQTMVDVLNQQSLLFQAQQSYATDRYNYVTSLINLKSDTGTLSQEDLEAINGWLGEAPAAKAKKDETSLSVQTLKESYVSELSTKEPASSPAHVNAISEENMDKLIADAE